ncbi:lasso peptide biosynthesis PqqD family chaperone [Streptomyces sp. NPDC020845]|uniref:lasso peptide biosynthesis PqqD family chaperone n=1 Tax=Streptomyces sp. NPDC020845 TaxID=3365096 RepID=UPI00378B7B1D
MTFSLATHVTVTDTEHGVVLLDENTGRYWQMNRTAAVVLRCLHEGGTTATAISELVDSFPDLPDVRTRVTEDVHRLLDALRAAELGS